jgi:hypothetical protein
MRVRKRDQIEFVLWAFLSLGAAMSVNLAHLGVELIHQRLSGCIYATSK